VYQSEAKTMRAKSAGIFKFALPALAAAFVLSSVPANATTYILDRGDMPNHRTLNISGLGNVWAGPILFDGTYGANGPAFIDLVAFCVDIYHSITLGNYTPDLTYTDTNALTFDSNSGGQANHYSGPSGLGAANVTKIGVLANYGTLVAKDNSLSSGTKNDRLAAVQGAIWQVASGRNVTGAGLDNLIDNLSGNSYQNFFVGNYGPINSSFKLITPTVYPGVRGTQSFVIAVPEPATWAMMIGGFATIGAMLRRLRLTSADATA
jgi:hypothetical protein